MNEPQETAHEAEEQAVAPERSIDPVLAALAERFQAGPDPRARWDDAVRVAPERLIDCLQALRDDFGFTLLLDIAGVDYLAYPDHRDERFGVCYLLKNHTTCDRLRVKVLVEEGEEELPTCTHLWKNADWAEREVWDQYGIRFAGHPNLKRLLNHHEFQGHPLRKDYPVQKRQKLSVNDPMLDELLLRLRQRGYEVLDEEGVRL